MVERGVKFLCVPAVPVMSWVGGIFLRRRGGLKGLPRSRGAGL